MPRSCSASWACGPGTGREDISARGIYSTDTYDAANNLVHVLWALAIVALVYVAACLLLTPRAGAGGHHSSDG